MADKLQNPEFRGRLAKIIGDEEPFSWAKRIGIPTSTFSRIWTEGTIPTANHLIRISTECSVDLNWLILGSSVTPNSEFLGIPRYDARLAAGDGVFNDRAQLIDFIPFTKDFLVKKIGRSSTEGLSVVEVRGDSMEPTIGDGDLVLVDQTNKDFEDGIVTFVLDDMTCVKRIRRFFDGIEIISDNRDLYPPMLLERDRINEMQIIGRVRWCGRVFGR